MPKPVIRWSKQYHEDLGPRDEQGYFIYAYRYYMYDFHAPTNGSKITIRQYLEERTEGSLFIYFPGYEVGAKAAVVKEARLIGAIVDFLKAMEGMSQFKYFDGSYKLLGVAELPGKREEFTFRQIPSGD